MSTDGGMTPLLLPSISVLRFDTYRYADRPFPKLRPPAVTGSEGVGDHASPRSFCLRSLCFWPERCYRSLSPPFLGRDRKTTGLRPEADQEACSHKHWTSFYALLATVQFWTSWSNFGISRSSCECNTSVPCGIWNIER
uniref:Uncharacterized protein MANES_18G141200 n=1 Tax=Rhizophora mucronata TaxID=61149 RepID=A0A2P2K4I6_RHIMU